ncbi:hypothetical protein BD413DRAFT_617620 [Trametes elegans]|nr:hypothetical protein BD413DRAFT_617620 [Trametes elegans]
MLGFGGDTPAPIGAISLEVDPRAVSQPEASTPTIRLAVGEERFTEDWVVFRVGRATRLEDSFQGNKIDLETKISPKDFTLMCSPRADANWHFDYPPDRLHPHHGTLTVFPKPGDSISVIADIRGRVGGILTSGAGMTGKSPDVTYATTFNWVLERIKADGFPNASLDDQGSSAVGRPVFGFVAFLRA